MAPFILESEWACLLTKKLGYKIAIQNPKLKKKKYIQSDQRCPQMTQ